MKTDNPSISNNGYVNLSRKDKKEALAEAAVQLQILPVILEKDFWVCWILGLIFSDPELSPHFVFKDWGCEVTALELERTFWETATILHAEHHRPEGHDMPVRHARHYSDFSSLLSHENAMHFLADQAMCLRVTQWKSQVFARKWARYDLALHGSFKLVPPLTKKKTQLCKVKLIMWKISSILRNFFPLPFSRAV